MNLNACLRRSKFIFQRQDRGYFTDEDTLAPNVEWPPLTSKETNIAPNAQPSTPPEAPNSYSTGICDGQAEVVKRKKIDKFQPPTVQEISQSEDTFKEGRSIGRLRHAVLVQLFVSRTKKSKQHADGMKRDELIRELQKIRVNLTHLIKVCV